MEIEKTSISEKFNHAIQEIEKGNAIISSLKNKKNELKSQVFIYYIIEYAINTKNKSIKKRIKRKR